MYSPEMHDRAWRNRQAPVLGDRLPSFKEASEFVFSEWPTASPARQAELAEALAIVARNQPPTPATPPRPVKTIAALQREWCEAPPKARRIFNDNFGEFLRTMPWRR